MAKRIYNDKKYKANRLRVLKAAAYTCYYCGDYATTVDHVIPVIRGGTNDEFNLVACCSRCNSSKQDRQATFFGQRKTPRLPFSFFSPNQTEQPQSGFKRPSNGLS